MAGIVRIIGSQILRGSSRAVGGRRGNSARVQLVLVWSIIPEVIALVEVKAAKAVAETVVGIATEAQARAPVQTGALRASISPHVGYKDGHVKVDAEYAAYVEYGTYKMPAKPYLQPAVSKHEDAFFAAKNFFPMASLKASSLL